MMTKALAHVAIATLAAGAACFCALAWAMVQLAEIGAVDRENDKRRAHDLEDFDRRQKAAREEHDRRKREGRVAN